MISAENSRKKFLLINNIPTPYRTYMYSRMYHVAKEYDIDMEVVFLARREARRWWDPEQLGMDFPFRYACDRHGKPYELFSWKVFAFGMLRQVMSGQYDWVMAAAAQSPANWLLFGLPSMRQTARVLYSELDPNSARLHYGWRKMMRNLVYRECDALVTPGRQARDFLVASRASLEQRPYYCFPNVVDPHIFDCRSWAGAEGKAQIREKYDLDPEIPLLVGIGAAECKGGLSLIEALRLTRPACKVVILGGDSFRETLLRVRTEAGVENILELPGSVAPEVVAEYLSMADGYLHPAHHDCSPLCCVEAAFNGLPLLLSRQTGNHCELLEPGRNGWLFDGKSPEEIAAALTAFLRLPAAEREKMGECSNRIAHERFDAVKLAHGFFVWLRQEVKPR